MLVKKIKYTDYNGEAREKEYMFNLNKAECFKLNASKKGGLMAYVKDMISSNNLEELSKVFDEIIYKSLGYVSGDGQRFVKSDEYTKEFIESEAYVELFVELFSRDGAFSDFMIATMPPMSEDDVKAAKEEAQRMIGHVGS